MEFAILREVQEDILFGIKKQRESRSSYQVIDSTSLAMIRLYISFIVSLMAVSVSKRALVTHMFVVSIRLQHTLSSVVPLPSPTRREKDKS